jgi:predicted signal transduction protein with EAL and GGDEF domain
VRAGAAQRAQERRVFWNDLRIDPVVNIDGEITHFVGVINDVTEARHYERRLQHLAHHDPLTGLANRTLLQDRLKQPPVARCARNTRERWPSSTSTISSTSTTTSATTPATRCCAKWRAPAR